MLTDANILSENEKKLYTDAVRREIYAAKSRLPKDFTLYTKASDYDVAIIIVVDMSEFSWRTVEDRLAIALVLTALCKNINQLGIWCLIEKSAPGEN